MSCAREGGLSGHEIVCDECSDADASVVWLAKVDREGDDRYLAKLGGQLRERKKERANTNISKKCTKTEEETQQYHNITCIS